MTRSAPVTLQIPGLEPSLALYLHGEQDQFVSRRLRQEGVWEPYETALVQAMLRPGDVVVDVGANIGYFSVLGAALVGPQGAVFAFEPDPDNCRLLRASAQHNALEGIITLVEGGLSDTHGDGQLFLSRDNLGDHQIYAGDEQRDALPVQLFNGSNYLAQRIDRLDLLKVDTQGSEYQVMNGLMPLLENLPQPPRIMIELTPFSLQQAGASGRALIELLARLNQPLWIIDHIEHRLVRSSAAELALWCDNVAATDQDRGFMNILVGREL